MKIATVNEIIDLGVTIQTLKIGNTKLSKALVNQFMRYDYVGRDYGKGIKDSEGVLIAMHRIGLKPDDEGVMYLWQAKNGEILNGMLTSEMCDTEYNAEDFYHVRSQWHEIKKIDMEFIKLKSAIESEGIPKWAILEREKFKGLAFSPALETLYEDYKKHSKLEVIRNNNYDEESLCFEERSELIVLSNKLRSDGRDQVLDYLPSYGELIDDKVIESFQAFCSNKMSELKEEQHSIDAGVRSFINQVNDTIRNVLDLPLVYVT